MGINRLSSTRRIQSRKFHRRFLITAIFRLSGIVTLPNFVKVGTIWFPSPSRTFSFKSLPFYLSSVTSYSTKFALDYGNFMFSWRDPLSTEPIQLASRIREQNTHTSIHAKFQLNRFSTRPVILSQELQQEQQRTNRHVWTLRPPPRGFKSWLV